MKIGGTQHIKHLQTLKENINTLQLKYQAMVKQIIGKL
jgi:hypothetical protein